ncbi:hypothetical protein ACFWY5_37215 [Nonomuraea sp. NPDC059007]|uniref:hypothetical protein n=1 Tax=Nonomuraea sp. NPDC059007 TaxID=3346692 RepID=UPI0036A1F5CE
MSITILDYVAAKVGIKDSYTSNDHVTHGVNIIGGCESCDATIASYNAYPSKTGYWRCAHCIGDSGYPTVAAFEADTF